ncbi:MAG TPA: GTPase Era [Bacilli bacterium]|nr:GTPase Era [Bacilli bacterium]
MTKSGFVTIAGRPNAGKSTLLNAIFQEKRAIVTPKPQTTNVNVQGVYNDERGQIVFVDTPGLHKPKSHYGAHLNKQAYQSIRGSDVTLLVIDASVPFGPGDQYLKERLKIDNEMIIVLTKIDLARPYEVDALKGKYAELYPDVSLIEVSSVRNFNIDALLDEIFRLLPEGPLFYPDPKSHEVDKEKYISEVVREKIMNLTEQEVPYSIAVVTDHLEVTNKIVAYVSIICERDSQKGILIGKKGKMIKRIRLQSQYDLSHFFKMPAEMEIKVKVNKNWRSDPKIIEKLIRQ